MTTIRVLTTATIAFATASLSLTALSGVAGAADGDAVESHPLPHTADAAEGTLAQYAAKSNFVRPEGLPQTADAIEAWLD